MPNDEAPRDLKREMCVRQGYVPPGCTLAGPMIWGLLSRGEDPCDGCAEIRARCGGRPPANPPARP